MIFLTGFLMAIADSMPGVSGGTIAYILQQYEQLFDNLNKLIRGDFNKQVSAYLVKLAIGWIIGFILAIFAITAIFESHIYQISSLFLGFIFISSILIFRREKDILKPKNYIFTILGFIIVIILVMFQNSGLISLDTANLSISSYIYIFIVGIIAISAMLLPGISGSAILMIFGIYFLVIEAIHSFLTFDFSLLPILLALGLGILTGAIISVKAISYLFKQMRSIMVHLIIGLLLGSLISIIYGPTTIDNATYAPLSFTTFNIGYFFTGICLIAILEYVQMSK